MKIKSYIL